MPEARADGQRIVAIVAEGPGQRLLRRWSAAGNHAARDCGGGRRCRSRAHATLSPMTPTWKRICVFCGSNVGRNPAFREAAEELGAWCAERGVGVVFGAGKVGLMGVVADAALARGGEVIGVIPHGLMEREVGHTGCSELHVVDTMHQRKTLMHELSDAFVTLPGGWGSFEELLETVTWSQLGIHAKPVGVLNVAGYYDGLVDQLDRAIAEGFIRPENRGLVVVDETLEGLLSRLAEYESPVRETWLDPSRT